MAIERSDFDALSLADLNELVDAQVPEGLRLEYKKELYGTSDRDKRELLKDVSALANSHGGHLVLGIDETAGVATEVAGIESQNSDNEVLRIEQMVRSGIEPVISGIRIRSIPVEPNRYVFVLRIPRSSHPPHRVIAKGTNRFYARHSAGVHEPSIEELRVLFTQSSSALNQARQFRDDRIAAVCTDKGSRPLVSGGRVFLHIVPIAAFSGMVNLDLEAVHAHCRAFTPIGHITGMTPRFNYHGFINERGGEDNHGYTQIFRNGCLEATKGGIVREQNDRRIIPGIIFEQHIFGALTTYVCGLRDVGVPPPLIIMITLEGVANVNYQVQENLFADYEPPLPNNVLRLPEGFLEAYGEDADHHHASHSAFDALWNAIGYSRSKFFNGEGRWIGPR